MLLNRVRCEVSRKMRGYFDRIWNKFLPLKGSIFLICDTLLLIRPKKQQQFYAFFNISLLKHKFRLFFTRSFDVSSTR